MRGWPSLLTANVPPPFPVHAYSFSLIRSIALREAVEAKVKKVRVWFGTLLGIVRSACVRKATAYSLLDLLRRFTSDDQPHGEAVVAPPTPQLTVVDREVDLNYSGEDWKVMTTLLSKCGVSANKLHLVILLTCQLFFRSEIPRWRMFVTRWVHYQFGV